MFIQEQTEVLTWKIKKIIITKNEKFSQIQLSPIGGLQNYLYTINRTIPENWK